MLTKKKAIPSKKTLNLMIIESGSAKFRRIAPIVIICAIAIALFGKLAVADRLMEASRLEQQVLKADAKLGQLEAELENFEDVSTEYSRYFSEGLGAGKEVIPLDCTEALKIVKTVVMSSVDVSGIEFKENTVALLLTGNQMVRAAELMPRLEQLPEVAAVTLHTANSQAAMTEGLGVGMQLTITFQEVLE